MNKLTFLILLFLTLFACEERVKFEKPQPPDRNNLNAIPGKLQGTYLSNADSALLTIDEQRIIEWTDIEYRTVLDSLDMEVDSSLFVNPLSDTIQLTEGMFNIRLKFLPLDSVIVFYSYRDTVFEISNQQIIRKFKGHYFLNYEQTENNWSVRRLTLNRDELSFSKVRLPEDISELQEITEVEELKSDSGKVVSYRLNPTRKELKKLLKRSFSETTTYQKLK